MNSALIYADIARRIPAMAQDSAENNETLLKGLLEPEFERLRKENSRLYSLAYNEHSDCAAHH